jgi:hypothetical protein
LVSIRKKIHEYFYSCDIEHRLSHLTAIKQKHYESIINYIRRFRDIRNQCFNLNIFNKDLADLTYLGLTPHLKEKLESHVFSYVSQVLQWALNCESRAKQFRSFPRSSEKPRNERHINMVEYSSELLDDEEADVCMRVELGVQI